MTETRGSVMTFSRTQVVVGVSILLLATALRLYGITRWSLNNDEIAQVRWSSGSFSEMLGEVRRDVVHPPLDYVAQWLLGKAGVPEWMRRLAPLAAGLLTVAGFMLLGRWWHSPAAGAFAGVLLAVSPAHVRYSQEVRPYATGILFVMTALVALELYAMTKRRRWAGVWFASVFLAGATLYLAGAVAVVASITRIWLDRHSDLRPVWKRLPLAVVGWTLMYAPWLGVVLHAARSAAPAAPERPDWLWWEHRLHAFSTGPELFAPMTAGAWMFWLAVAGGIVISRDVPRLRTATSWLIAGSGLTIVILQLRPHFPNTPRYLMPAMIAGALLAAAGLAALWRGRAGRVVALIALAVIVSYAVPSLQWYYADGRPRWRDVAQFVHDRVQPGDKVVLTNNWVTRNFGYYWERMPPLPITIQEFYVEPGALEGPAWIVTGQCAPRAPLLGMGVIAKYRGTAKAEVRYLPAGSTVATTAELCPE